MAVTFPKFLSSDEELNITYNYRCELYGRHVKETPAGYVITEFLPDVPWAGNLQYHQLCRELSFPRRTMDAQSGRS